MPEHQHRFEPATIIPMAGGRVQAWVPTREVTPPESTPNAWKCFDCGEQGYAIPAR